MIERSLVGPHDADRGPIPTRLFHDNQGQVVRIPATIAYGQDDAEVEISRHGETLMIRPKHTSYDDLVAFVRQFSPEAVSGRRQPHQS